MSYVVEAGKYNVQLYDRNFTSIEKMVEKDGRTALVDLQGEAGHGSRYRDY